MKTKICYTIMVLLSVFLQDIYAQQKDTIELVFRHVPKRTIDFPCQKLEDCIEKVTCVFRNNDTLYICYDMDSSRVKGKLMIDGFTNIRHNYKLLSVVPATKGYDCKYIVIRYGKSIYFFEKRRAIYIYQIKKSKTTNFF